METNKHKKIYTNCTGKSPSLETHMDFLGGPVVKNSGSSAGNVGAVPGQGNNIPHAEEN